MSSNFSAPKITDWQYQNCMWVAPTGAKFIELAYAIPWYFTAVEGQIYNGLEQAANSQYDFLAKSIGAVVDMQGLNECLVQIQWPDGRYLSNPGLPFYDFAGTGYRGWCLENPELLPKGSKIKINVDNSQNGTANVNLSLFFEGVLRIPLVGANPWS